jgi:hypothetical protein
VLSVETLIVSKLIVVRRRDVVVVVDISTTGAKLPLRIERAQFSKRNKVEPHGLFYIWWRNEEINHKKFALHQCSRPKTLGTQTTTTRNPASSTTHFGRRPHRRCSGTAILGLLDTPSSSFFGATSTPAPTDVDTSHRISSGAVSAHHNTMSTTDRPRLPEASLAPKTFGGSAPEIDNAERWLRYLNQYVQYRNLRDDEALTLFKLLLTDQAQDWLYALPEDQADSFHRLQEAFMSRYTPNPLQRYQKASHMWSRMQQDNESVDSYFTSIISAAIRSNCAMSSNFASVLYAA